MKETTFIFLKPDAVARKLQEPILARFREVGLEITFTKEVEPTRELITEHYKELASKYPEVFKRNVPFFLSGTLVLALVTGEDAIKRTRALIGATEKAAKGTIRGDYATDTIALADSEGRGLENLIHSSDSPAAVEREMAIWLPNKAPVQETQEETLGVE